MHIEPGAQAREQRIVTDSDTAIALGTGDVPVLATSRVFAWCEAATLSVLARDVPAGSTSVALRVHIDHIRAAKVGCAITVIATLERIEGRRLVFVVAALNPNNEEVAFGRIVRVAVEAAPFLEKACGPAK